MEEAGRMRPPSPRRQGTKRGVDHREGERVSSRGSGAEVVDVDRSFPEERGASLEVAGAPEQAALVVPVASLDAASVLGGPKATDLADRLRERARARRVLLARRVGVFVAVLAAVAGVLWVAFVSPLFALSSSAVTVSGQDGSLVTVESVRSSVASFEGVPLTRLDTREVARAVESNVAVKSAAVSRRWPTSLRVAVTMRQAMAVEVVSDSYWLIDDQGVAFQRVDDASSYPVANLPEDRAGAVADIASALGALDEGTRAQVAAISSTASQVSFVLRKGASVKWGTREDAPQKARVLATLLANVNASVYDVSSPNHPVTS